MRKVVALSPIAESLLREGGQVCGVFSSASGILCGDLTVMLQKDDIATPCGGLLSVYRPEEWENLIGADVFLRDSKLIIGNGLCYDAAHMKEWKEIHMKSLPHMKKEECSRALNILKRQMCVQRKEMGMSPLLEMLGWSQGEIIEETEYYHRSEKAIKLLRRGILEGDVSRIQRAQEGLVGFGAGLTPSGDDFLTGFWSTIQMRYDGGYQDEFRKAIHKLTELAKRTTVYGWSELWAMQQGYCSQPLMDVVRKLGESSRLDESVIRLAQIGGTTGVDTLLGIAEAVMALEGLNGKEQILEQKQESGTGR